MTNASRPPIEEIKARAQKTGDELSKVIKNGCSFYMNIPARPDEDFDLLVGRLTSNVEEMAAYIEHLESQLNSKASE